MAGAMKAKAVLKLSKELPSNIVSHTNLTLAVDHKAGAEGRLGTSRNFNGKQRAIERKLRRRSPESFRLLKARAT